MAKPKSTHCRYCNQPLGDDNCHGAHRKCFNNKPQFDPSIPGAREAHNRNKAIQRRMRDHGVTRQEAEAHYDAATVPCECEAAKARNAKYCTACAKVHAAKRSAAWMAEHRELERMRDRVRHRMKTGLTLEQAQAMESTRGTCGCGKPARRKNGRICEECYKAQDRDAHNGVVRLFEKICAECNAPFKGSSRAKYCERHKKGVVPGKTRGWSGKVNKPTLPNDWLKPSKLVLAPPPVERIINPGVEVTRIPSMFAGSRWTSPDEFNPETVRAVAEVMGRIGR
jgi:hypothetical protein